ncbi:hypothetical protein HYW61_00185 [candidate division WWE3 bacterium]|nr:hypothetical protein [candidate division WWE3 bacterium]
MSEAILVVGKRNAKERVAKILDGTDDLNISFVLPEEGKNSIGIDQVRGAVSFLMKKPVEGKEKALVFQNADLLTIPAQNALLKTLEEPPSYAKIILAVKTENSLLPTVVSRCKRIYVLSPQPLMSSQPLMSPQPLMSSRPLLSPQPLMSSRPLLSPLALLSSRASARDPAQRRDISTLPLGSRFSTIESLSKQDKQTVIDTLETWIEEQRRDIAKSPEKSLNIKRLIEVKKDLENTNISQRLALEHLMLNLR